MTKKLRIAFMGTPDISIPTLKTLLTGPYEVVAVYTQPPRPKGRGYDVQKSPVHELAESHGIPVYTPLSLRKDPAACSVFNDLNLDAAVVLAYGLILPKSVLDAPRLGCINVHTSLLPRWRGAAPIQRAIEAGDGVTGITIMLMDEGLDTGPILIQHSVPICPQTTSQALHDQLAVLGAELIPIALEGLDTQTLMPQPQPDEGVTYAEKIQKEEGFLRWDVPAFEVDCKIRAFTPWPGTWFEHDHKRVKVLEAKLSPFSGKVGNVLDDHLTIGCAKGSLQLLKVQKEGSKAMTAHEFLRGVKIPKGTQL